MIDEYALVLASLWLSVGYLYYNGMAITSALFLCLHP